MRKASALLVIGAALVVAAGTAFAGETFTVQISCTIPAIPGVNAPLEEATTYSDSTRTAFAEPDNEINTDSPDETGEKKDNKDDSGKVENSETSQFAMIKTFYSR